MRVDLSKIKHKPGGVLPFSLEGSLDPAACGFSEYTLADPLICEGSAVNNGKGEFALNGSYHTTVILECSRCGQSFTQQVAGEFAASFISEADEDWNGERSVFDMDGDFAVLDSLITGEIFFSLPMQPLCREDCRGLCPICGQDLNTGNCSCQEDTIDPRWEKLKAFISDD